MAGRDIYFHTAVWNPTGQMLCYLIGQGAEERHKPFNYREQIMRWVTATCREKVSVRDDEVLRDQQQQETCTNPRPKGLKEAPPGKTLVGSRATEERLQDRTWGHRARNPCKESKKVRDGASGRG